jgi:hypothetical protein
VSRLDTDRNLWVCTVRPDGRPHLTPTWFVHADGAFWIGTGLASVKVRNVLANPAVSVSLEDGDRPLVAEGRASLVDRPFPDAVVAGFDVTRPEDDDVGTVALLRIDVDRWLMGAPDR